MNHTSKYETKVGRIYFSPVNAYKYRAHLNKLDTEFINNGLFSGKIYHQHDNAMPHAAKIVQEKIEKFVWELLPHPPYSPN